MVVRTINNEFPDFSGNININFTGALYDANGIVDRQIKMWTGTTTTGSDGQYSINYTSAGFEQVLSIQTTLETKTNTAGDKPLGNHIISKNLTTAQGKAYKVSSAGLLAAMQQIAAEAGTLVYVTVIGY